MKTDQDTQHMFYLFAKRVMDVIISIIAILILSPLLLIISTAIILDSTGPVFADTPKRVGKGGKPFFMYKFRSMIPNAYHILSTEPKYKELYEKYKANNYKLETNEDPRITKVGKFIRKTSIDELPQFINVLKGEMSVVGPRAYYASELREQAERYPKLKKSIQKALSVKPGITGPWQVAGRSTISFSRRIIMDAEYAKKRSIFYDLKILLKTPLAVVAGRGAY